MAQFADLGVEVAFDTLLDDSDVVKIWDINGEPWRAFFALGTQWRVVVASTMETARSFWVGLDYAAIPPVFELLGIEERTATFADLQDMEQAALEAFAEGEH